MSVAVKKLRLAAFALDENLEGEYKVADHLNLCGKAVKDIGFIPISDLYLDKDNPDALKVVCLKEGVEPSAEEKAVLLQHGIKAYSYELIEPALRAAANGEKVEAVVFFPKLPKGFSLSARACSIKESGALDLGVIESESAAIWAGTFTENKARAFCVDKNISMLDTKIKRIVCNSGNANACTGEAGKAADLKLRSHFEGETLVASTGKIGVTLPVEKILSAYRHCEAKPKQSPEADRHVASAPRDDSESIKSFAQAILTTDTCIKISQDPKQNFLGFAKGSGMIHPQMATMLAFIITDKKIEALDEAQTKTFMQDALRKAVAESFNAISVDGDSSTNDMCILINNCQSEVISQEEFSQGLNQVCQELASKIVADGEGLTKVSKLTIKSDLSDLEARELGRFILNSALVKTALHGNDPNWGRIVASLGQYFSGNLSQQDFDLNKVSLKILGEAVFASGLNTDFDREALIAKMKKSFELNLELGLTGTNTVTVFGNDLSHDYIKINAEYFT